MPLWNMHSALRVKCLYAFPTFRSPTLTFPFGWLCGLEADLFGRLLLLMEWLRLSWLPLTCSPWLHTAMPLLRQEKVKDHSKSCTGPALLLIKQACRTQTVNVDMHAGDGGWEGTKGGLEQKTWMWAVGEKSERIMAALLICSAERLWSREMEI